MYKNKLNKIIVIEQVFQLLSIMQREKNMYYKCCIYWRLQLLGFAFAFKSRLKFGVVYKPGQYGKGQP